MLGNCDKMLLIPSLPPNQWSQNILIDDQKPGTFNTANNNNTNNSNNMVSVIDQKHQQQQQQQQQKQQNQEPFRCPRCDSTNTKFCYYNNYSLSQPRHFCKACKRYWTRGGTLRNVPAGGGCRKNKRVKRPSSTTINSCSSSSTSNNNSNNNSNNLDATTSANSVHDFIYSTSNHINPSLFYASDHMSFPFSRYDLQNPPQINGIGLGFSCGEVELRGGLGGFNVPVSKQIFQDLISSNHFLSNYTNSTTTITTTPTSSSPSISSLLASSLHLKGGNNFQTILPSYEQDETTHMKGGGGMFMKDVKMELEGQNRNMEHHHWNGSMQNHVDQQHQTMDSSSTEPSGLWGGGGGAGGVSNLGAWLDPSNNIGSSVPSLI